MADAIGKLSQTVQLRRWVRAGGLDGRQNGRDVATESELVATLRTSRTMTENALKDETTGLMTEAAIDWTIRKQNVVLHQPNLFFYWNGIVHDIIEILPSGRTRLLIRTRQRIAKGCVYVG